MAEKLIKKLNNREFYAKYSDYAAMDEHGERLSDRKVKSVELDAASGTMTVLNTDGSQEIPVVPVPDQEGKVLKSNADGTYAWGAAGAEPGSGKLYVKFGRAPEVDTNFNANSDSKVTLVIPLASAVEGNKEDGLMSSDDKGVLDGLPNKIGGLDDRINTIEHDYVTSQGLQTALSPIQGDVASLEGQVESLGQGKADKVSPAISGNLASLDAGGDLADSGISGTAVSDALTKLGGIAPGAQVNVIEGVKLGETALTPDANKVVTVPLFNGSANGAVAAPASEYRTNEYFLNGMGDWSKVDLSEYIQKVTTGTAGNIPALVSGGGLEDSGVASADLTSKPGVSGGTALSMVTTGEKYTWDNWTTVNRDIPPTNYVKIAGRKYEIKKFGNNEWMMESLKYDTDTENALYINPTQNVYYYSGDFIFNSEEFASIIPAGWRIPTISDRDALVSLAGGQTAEGASYLYRNFNAEPSSFYDGYHSYPGGYLTDWQFCTITIGNGPIGAILIDKRTPPILINSNNAGGGGYSARYPVRLCRTAPVTQG